MQWRLEPYELLAIAIPPLIATALVVWVRRGGLRGEGFPWLLLILLLPGVGAVLYLLLGKRRA